MSGAGRAPEILVAESQAKLRGITPEEAAKQLQPPPPVPVIQPPLSAPPPPPAAANAVLEAPVTETIVTVPEGKQVDPVVAKLEMLPDEELWKEAESKGIRADRKWTRERLLGEIVYAIRHPSPPPPPAAPTN